MLPGSNVGNLSGTYDSLAACYARDALRLGALRFGARRGRRGRQHAAREWMVSV
eukprot:gene8110-19338_t